MKNNAIFLRLLLMLESVFEGRKTCKATGAASYQCLRIFQAFSLYILTSMWVYIAEKCCKPLMLQWQTRGPACAKASGVFVKSFQIVPIRVRSLVLTTYTLLVNITLAIFMHSFLVALNSLINKNKLPQPIATSFFCICSWYICTIASNSIEYEIRKRRGTGVPQERAM